MSEVFSFNKLAIVRTIEKMESLRLFHAGILELSGNVAIHAAGAHAFACSIALGKKHNRDTSILGECRVDLANS
jgi:hypothetical protein